MLEIGHLFTRWVLRRSGASETSTYIAGISRLGLALVGLGITGCATMEADLSAVQSDDVQIQTRTEAQVAYPDSEALYQLLVGEIAGRYGAYTQATEHYLEALAYSQDPKVAERATQIALYAGVSESALEAAWRWVELAPTDTAARQTLAILLLRNGKPDEAVVHLKQVVEAARQQSPSGFMVIAATLAQEKDQALGLMKRLVEVYSREAEAHRAYAELALRLEDYPAALAAVDRALKLEPSHPQARLVQAQVLTAQGHVDQALAGIKAALDGAPDNAELRLAYARLLVQASRYDEAKVQFESLLKLLPNDATLLYTLALINLEQRRYEAATVTLERLLKTGERTDEAHYYLGRVAEEQGNLTQAVMWYRKIDQGLYVIEAHSRVAAIYAKQGDLNEARAYLQRLRSGAQDEVAVGLYIAEGQVLQDVGQYRTAISVYDQALTEYPKDSDLLYARALAAEKINRLDLLEADLRSILADDPDNTTALNALGYTLADRTPRLDEAYDYIRRAYKTRPDDPAVMDSMGWVLFRKGQYQDAENYLRRALSILPDGEIAGHLSEVVWQQGDKGGARQILKEALSKEPDNSYLRRLHKQFNTP